MTYGEVLLEAARGRKIRRPHWNKHVYYMFCGDLLARYCKDQSDGDVYVYKMDAIADDWEVMQEPVTFVEAMQAVVGGKQVRRLVWHTDWKVVVNQYSVVYTHNCGPYKLCLDDIRATDWIILEDTQ